MGVVVAFVVVSMDVVVAFVVVPMGVVVGEVAEVGSDSLVQCSDGLYSMR